MDAEGFVKALSAYYGAYKSPAIVYMIKEWVSARPEIPLDSLFRYIVEDFSSQYGKQPDVAVISQSYQEHRKDIEFESGNYRTEDGIVFRDGEQIGHYDGARFIPNLAPIQGDGILEFRKHYTEISGPDDYWKYLKERLRAGRIDDGDKKRLQSPESVVH